MDWWLTVGELGLGFGKDEEGGKLGIMKAS